MKLFLELLCVILRTLGGLYVRLAALADEVYEIISGIAVRYSIIRNYE